MKARMLECADVLKEFGVPYSMQVLSAHRTPDLVAKFATNAAQEGKKVIIAGAGAAAHLAGAIAANTTLPVIGVPLSGSELHGVDALYSIVQMPAGIPVATVAVGGAGARNAAVLAAEILALSDGAVRKKLAEFRKNGSKF